MCECVCDVSMARPRILELRIITLGDALVGKSSLLKNYLETLSGTPTDLEVKPPGVDTVAPFFAPVMKCAVFT